MKKQFFIIPLLFFFITLLFFYPVLKGHIPFPGDLLVGHYSPYNSLSLNGYDPGAVPHKAQGIDVVRELFPWKHFVIESFKNGYIPFWNPYQFSGQALLANFQSGAFYPLNLLFIFSDFIFSWTLFIFFIPFLSMLFVYFFLRSHQLSRPSAIFSGVVFAFSSYMVVWMEYGNIGHTLLWLPLALYSIEKMLKKYSAIWSGVFLLSMTSSFFAGYIQGYFYITLIALLYFLIRRNVFKKENVRSSLLFLVLLLLPLLIGAVQLLPTLSQFTSSSRGNYSLAQIQQLLNPVWYTITVIIPDFFGHPASRNMWVPLTYIERVSYFGLIPFIFALFAIMTMRKQKVVILFALLFILSFLITLDLHITKYLYQIPIPVISTTVPTRALSIFVFAGSILSGFGIDHFLKRKELKKLGIILGSVSAFFLVIWIIVLLNPQGIINESVAMRNLVLPTFLLLGLIILFIPTVIKRIIPKLEIVILSGIFFLTIFDLFYFFHKVTPFSEKGYIYPSTPLISFIQKNAGIDRYWGYGSAAIISNFQMMDHTFSVEGNDPLHSVSYEQFLNSTREGVPKSDLERADSLLAPGFGAGNFTTNPYRLKALSLMGVKYIVNKNDSLGTLWEPDSHTFPEKDFRLIWQEKPFQVYENRQSAKRVFVTDNYKVVGQKEFFSEFYSKELDETNTLLLFEDPKLKIGRLTKKSAVLTSYQPNEVIVKTTTDAPGLLFLSDSYSPDWKAVVDGRMTKVFIANYTFRAVAIPKGSHTVKFYHDSASFKLGMLVSLFAITVSIILLWKVRIRSL